MAEEVKNSPASASLAQQDDEPTATMIIDTSEPMANHKITPALLEITESWKKGKLDEMKSQQAEQAKPKIIRESWGGDRESASVTQAKQQPEAPA